MNEVVSIIVPMYNVEKYIKETIDCVLAQTYPHWELLLVEDCSADGTRKLVSGYRQRLEDSRINIIYEEKNAGAASARNHGLAAAKGRYIAYLDGDDLWMPDKLEKQLAFMKEKDAAFSFTGYEFADENGKGLGKVVHVPETLTYKKALSNTTIFTTTVMFDTEKLPKSSLEMPQIKSEDTALWFKVLRGGVTAYGLDENLVKYRRCGRTLSSNKLEAIRRIWNLYRKAEKMGIPESFWHLCFWAYRAVKRRI